MKIFKEIILPNLDNILVPGAIKQNQRKFNLNGVYISLVLFCFNFKINSDILCNWAFVCIVCGWEPVGQAQQ